MSESNPRHQEMHRLELIISQLLRYGVFVAGAMLTVGWLWMWSHGTDVNENLRDYNPTSFTDTLQWALIMKDRALLMAMSGLVVLVCLPVVRVFMTGILFVWQKDYKLAVMAFLVFFALLGSFLLGIDI